MNKAISLLVGALLGNGLLAMAQRESGSKISFDNQIMQLKDQKTNLVQKISNLTVEKCTYMRQLIDLSPKGILPFYDEESERLKTQCAKLAYEIEQKKEKQATLKKQMKQLQYTIFPIAPQVDDSFE